jgi:hypothetical protein
VSCFVWNYCQISSVFICFYIGEQRQMSDCCCIVTKPFLHEITLMLQQNNGLISRNKLLIKDARVRRR